eukprot:1332297-Rhodomonas_salina.1
MQVFPDFSPIYRQYVNIVLPTTVYTVHVAAVEKLIAEIESFTTQTAPQDMAAFESKIVYSGKYFKNSVCTIGEMLTALTT